MNYTSLLLTLLFTVAAAAAEVADEGKNKTRRDDESSDSSSSSSPSSAPFLGTPEPLSQPMPMFSPLTFNSHPGSPPMFAPMPPPPPPGTPFAPFYRPLAPPPPPHPHQMMQARMMLSHMPFLPASSSIMPLHQMKRWDEPSLFDSLLHSESHIEPFGSFLSEDPIEIDEEDLIPHRRQPPPSSRRESNDNHHNHHHHHHSHHNSHRRSHYRQALHEPDRHRSDPYEPIGMENRFDRPPYDSYRSSNDYNDDTRDNRDAGGSNNVAPGGDDSTDRYTPTQYDRRGSGNDHTSSSSVRSHGNSLHPLSPPHPTSSNGDFAEK